MRSVLVLLLLLACGKTELDEMAEQEKARAEQRSIEKSHRAAIRQVDDLTAQVAFLDTKVSAAVDDVVSAQNDNDRAAAKMKLERLRREKAEMEPRLAEAKRAFAQVPGKSALLDAKRELDQRTTDLADADKRVAAAVDAVVAAMTDTTRSEAQVRLAQMRREKAHLEEAVAKAKATLRHRAHQAE